MPNAIRRGRCTRGRSFAGVLLALAVGLASSVGAEITRIQIATVEPFASGASFGETGPYVRIAGVAAGELDPNDPRNAGIVNLDLAPRNERGRVEYEVDFFLLRPRDPARGSGKLLYDVTNRGSKVALGLFGRAARGGYGSLNDPRAREHAGDGLLFERGYTLVWSGWDPTVEPGSGRMTARFPTARGSDGPLEQRVRDEFVFGGYGFPVPRSARLTRLPVDRSPGAVQMAWRWRSGDPRVELPPESWEFVDERSIALTSGQAFEAGAIYDVWYTARDPFVLGMGFASTRDLVSFLRYESADASGTPNPAAASSAEAGIRHALAVGVSQSGRYLRHFVELGMNRDTGDRRVFDGVLPYIAGAGKLFANHAFGRPGYTAGQHSQRDFPENWFPFSHAVSNDPITARSGGLLRGDGFDPLVIEANTSTEYWHKGASLLHTDPAGRRDLPIPAGVRLFLVAGTEHAGGVRISGGPSVCANDTNPHDPSAALRALLVALDEWVSDGREPPASRVPTLAAGNLVRPENLAFPRLPRFAGPGSLNRIRPEVDWVDPPPAGSGPVYGARVPAVDADGNEAAGVRLPDIAVPTGTYTGWNVYTASELAGDLCQRSGSHLPFADGRATREGSGDPRPSLTERYEGRPDYVGRVREAVDELVAARLLLPEDGERYVQRAVRAALAFETPAER